ncbi:MAG: polysaccharide biosynthesis C-terminal domain-containing protein, partial [Gammaproteobacteria bacterium]|nr:polysaccharide biosynthesis C-terminal domain-containing protein [Gammaproteobacteria bacterium]
TRALSPADYGALDLLSMLTVIAPIAIGLALDQAVARFYLDTDDDGEKKRIASTVLFYNVAIFLCLIPLAWPFTDWMANTWLSGQIDRRTAVMVFVYMWVHSIFIVANNQLRFQFLSKQYALCHVGNVLVSTSLSILFVFFLRWGVIGVYLGQTIGQLLFGFVALYLGRRSYALTFHWPLLRRMVAYSLPLVPGTLSFYGMQYLDRVFINELRELKEVGLYSIGARLASLVNLFLMGFQGAWTPMVMSSFREEGAKERFRTVFEYYLFATMMIVAVLSLFGKETLILLTTRDFVGGYVVVPLLVTSAILASITGYFTYGIQIEKKSGYRLVINVAGVLVNCALNLLLIPRYGFVGAALATVLSYGFLATASMWISQRLYHVPYRWGRTLLAFGSAAAASCSVIFVDIPVGLPSLVAKVLALAGLAALLAALLGIDLRQLASGGILPMRRRRNPK